MTLRDQPYGHFTGARIEVPVDPLLRLQGYRDMARIRPRVREIATKMAALAGTLVAPETTYRRVRIGSCTPAALALETLGAYTVATMESGKGIVERARDFNPDLIILDVMMPDIDGPAALRALRDTPEFRDIPVIFMTAKVLRNEVDELEALVVQAVIAKPFDAGALAGQVQEVWDRLHELTAESDRNKRSLSP